MIKNIIFDIGNVLLDFNPEKYLDSLNFHKKVKEELFKCIFKSKYWGELDRGTLTDDEAIQLFCKASPKLNKEIKDIMSGWADILVPNYETVNIVKNLKEKGYKIFLLSNFHKKAFEKVTLENDFFNLFDGKVISYETNLLKPEEEIYKKLLTTYNLKPEESIFIDDIKLNIEGAKKLGINGILFESAASLEETLINAKVL